MTLRRLPSATGPWLYARPPAAAPRTDDAGGRLPAAVLFDRDGTLVADVPYNGDPARVEPMPTARTAVDAVRARGVPVGVVSNQSGVARGLLSRRQVEAVQRRVEELLGPFEVWAVCPHGPDDGCGCRKPAPGLVLAACARLSAPVERTVVIGDIGADLGAADAAGARGVLVPTPVTLPEETARAGSTAPDLLTAVRLALAPRSTDDPAGESHDFAAKSRGPGAKFYGPGAKFHGPGEEPPAPAEEPIAPPGDRPAPAEDASVPAQDASVPSEGSPALTDGVLRPPGVS